MAMYGYDPYQKDTNIPGLIGSLQGGLSDKVLQILMMMGMGGTGPFAGAGGGAAAPLGGLAVSGSNAMRPNQQGMPGMGGPQGGMMTSGPPPGPPPQMGAMSGPQGPPPGAMPPGTQGGMGGPGGMDPQMIQQLMSNPQMMQMILQLFRSRQDQGMGR